MLRDLVNDAALLHGRRKIDAALQHAAAVAVRRDVHRVGGSSVVHKLALLGPQALQAALNDMIAIQVPDERHHTLLQSIRDYGHLRAALQQVKSCVLWLKALVLREGTHIAAEGVCSSSGMPLWAYGVNEVDSA